MQRSGRSLSTTRLGRPDLEVPYAIAIVEFPEQHGLRMTTRLVDVPLDRVQIGMSVRVVFQPAGDLYLPFFTEAA